MREEGFITTNVFVGVILLILMGGLGRVTADDFDRQIQDQTRKLDRIAQELQKKRAERKSLQHQEAGILAQLRASEEELELTETYLKALNTQEDQLQHRIELTTRELAAAESLLAYRQQILERRLVEIYKFGKYNPLEVLLTANSFTDMIERYRYMQLIAAQDRALYNEIEAQKQVVAARKTELEHQLTELQRTIDLKVAEKATLEQERERRKALLQKIRTQKNSYERAIRELEQAQQEAQKIIDQLIAERERQRAAAAKAHATDDLSLGPDSKLPERSGNHYFDKQRGKINWPVQGKLLKKFGREKHPRFGTETFNQGIQIQAEAGTPIRVIGDGEVIYRSVLRGYGKFLIVDHGEGYYTLYAHCQSIEVEIGQIVHRGDRIATVGETGSIGGPSLYFEIRSFGEPVDPLLYLKR